MRKVKTNSGSYVTVLSIKDVVGILNTEFMAARMSGNLNWDRVQLKDSDYVVLSQNYVDNAFAEGVAKTLDLFQSDVWKSETKKNFGFASDVNYVKNSFDCDTYAAFTKMMAHVAVTQHYPELGAAPAFGRISYISGGSGAEQSGVGHEINFYISRVGNDEFKVKFFEPQEIYAGHGRTINLTNREVSSIFAAII